MTATRTFHLGDVLTITTGALVSPRHMDGVYDILNWMTGDDLMTHQLPRASNECHGPLLAQHPDLAAVVLPESFGSRDVDQVKANVERWLAEQVARFGETREVAPLDPADHTQMDPFTEMRKVAPHAQVITFSDWGQS